MRNLLLRKVISEVVGKAISVPPYLLVEPRGRYAIDSRQVGVEDRPPATNRQDRLLDLLGRH